MVSFSAAVFLIHEIHQRLIDGLQLVIIVQRHQDLLAVFFLGAQDADLQILFVALCALFLGGNERQIVAAARIPCRPRR